MSRMIPLADAKKQLSAIVKDADEKFDRFTVTRNGVSKAVIMSSEEYEGLLETLDILTLQENARLSPGPRHRWRKVRPYLWRRKKEIRCVMSYSVEFPGRLLRISIISTGPTDLFRTDRQQDRFPSGDSKGRQAPCRQPQGAFSLRVGDYRVVYELTARTVSILTVKHRKQVY